MKAILHYRASAGFRVRLAAEAPDWLRVVVVDDTDKATLRREMASADVLLQVHEPVTREVIANAPKLRLIHRFGVGASAIDLDAVRERGITVTNVPGSNAQAITEMTLALMLATLRRIPLLDRETRAGHGLSVPLTTFDSAWEIGGRRIGLIGYGEVPRRLTPVLSALGAEVVYTSHAAQDNAAAQWRDFPDLIASTDVISLHVPLNDATAPLINATAIARMRRGVVLINTAHPALIDEVELLRALQTGQVAAAGLDSLLSLPNGAEHPLATLDNVVITPQVAWLTAESVARGVKIAVENCRRLLYGESLRYQVFP